MASRPAYLGRGRGRGRGGSQEKTSSGVGKNITVGGQQYNDVVREKNVGEKRMKRQGSYQNSSTSDESIPGSPAASAEMRFQDVAAQHQQAVHRHLSSATTDQYESSSEEEELNDLEILNSVMKTFRSTGEVDQDMLGRTQDYLVNSVKAKANICLICIETTRRTDQIWSCIGCYTIFHISCIQKWVKDGVYQQTKDIDEEVDPQQVPWHCPKCRCEYKQESCPTRYYCFCGKEEDPTFDPWLVPHSCGQTCEKQLRPECGHRCLLLCHPGPCPPCPQTVRVTCYCGQQPPQTRRCGAKEWSCGQPCNRMLACDHHRCLNPCHSDECPPCPERSEQPCECGDERMLRPCASPSWQCEKICGKGLSCGHHICEKVCHKGDCGKCPRAGKRTCPCGKSEFELPCTEDVPTCLETCDKYLECGLHQCTQRCHTGPCGTCRQVTIKTCRCGQRSKEIQCFKEYTCDTKCTRMKDCRKHQCKKKCCDGNCPPCEQACNKMLGCHNHKCSSRCHRGPCYPCPLTVSVVCACQKSSITLPCGREKVTKPPRCKEKCNTPPDCHHERRLPHRCHFGRCPACKQICNKILTCSHTCPAPCHAAVLTKKTENIQRAGPWDPQPKAWTELVNKPCPPCQVPMQVTCFGAHEVVSLPCSIAKVASCHRPCGRKLPCMKHECELPCHTVKDAPSDNMAGNNCGACELGCEEPRPDGCSHQCLLPCHPGECPACTQMIRMRCHCKLIVQHIECYKWTEASDREKQKLKACPSRCPKMLPCNHQCTAFCHPGPCPSPEKCTERVKIRCSCRARKREFVCNEVQSGYAKVECDDICKQRKKKQQEDLEGKELAAKKQEEQRQKEEVEEFERKMKGRKRKPRKQRYEEHEPTFIEKYRTVMIVSVAVLFLSIVLYYLITAE